MLQLCIYRGEAILVGEALIYYIENEGMSQIRLGFDAPKEIKITREKYFSDELKEKILKGRRKWAESLDDNEFKRSVELGRMYSVLLKYLEHYEFEPVKNQIRDILTHLKNMEIK